MNLVKPKILKTGDTIAIVATSGDCDAEKILNAKIYFENNGYKVKLSENIFYKNNYTAGSDEDRANAINEAFADEQVNAIICARGGYGALRIIDKLDYELIKNNPKIFCGYSDISILCAMILKHSNLITFSAPMAQSDFGVSKINTYTEKCFYNALTASKLKIQFEDSKLCSEYQDAEGIILGGNLSSIVSLCGIDFLPDDKFIFIAEDLNESAYKIDRYFTQLFNIEKFKNNIQAIVLGDFLNLDNQDYFDDFLYNLGIKHNIPIISGFPISHDTKKITIPIGAYAKLTKNFLFIDNYLDE